MRGTTLWDCKFIWALYRNPPQKPICIAQCDYFFLSSVDLTMGTQKHQIQQMIPTIQRYPSFDKHAGPQKQQKTTMNEDEDGNRQLYTFFPFEQKRIYIYTVYIHIYTYIYIYILFFFFGGGCWLWVVFELEINIKMMTFKLC